MDDNKETIGQKQELMISEDVSVDDDVSENNIVEDSVVENNALNRSETDREQELLLKIEELDDAWNDLDIKRRDLYNQKDEMDKQEATLNNEKIKSKRNFRKLKFSKALSIFMLYFVAIIVGVVVYLDEDTNYNISRSTLSDSYNEQIKALDISRDNLIQQINDLQEDIAQREEILAQQEELLAQQKLAEQQTSLKEELTSQGGLSNITDTVLTEENRKELDTYIASLNRYPTQRIQQKKRMTFSTMRLYKSMI